MRMTRISTLFVLVVLGEDGKQFVQADCSSEIKECPIHSDGSGRYNCMAGVKNYSELFPLVDTSEINGLQCLFEEDCAHCDCNEDLIGHGMSGYTGLKCEIPFEICQDGNVCFHGAPCVAAKHGDLCACHEIGGDVTFLGDHCEYRADSVCTANHGQVDKSPVYCTNNGVCRDGIENPFDRCKCDTGFYGIHCELEYSSCGLSCKNGGICELGKKLFNFNDHDDYVTKTHCLCPEGYTGMLCETPVDICGAGTHHCLNNGKCVNDGEDDKCDCDSAISDTSYAGKYCEHPATSFCQGPGAIANSFCTNHGVCKEPVNDDTTIHGGCECDDPFYGHYCELGATLEKTIQTYCGEFLGFVCYNHGTCNELTDGTHPGCACDSPYFGDLCQFKQTHHNANKASKAFLGFTISLFGLLAIFFLIVLFRKKKANNRHIDHTPIGVPPEVHVHALDLDTRNDNTEIMGTGYEDIDDDEEEIMENVYIS